jgi:L-lactate dehydrogenase complex protein LldG
VSGSVPIADERGLPAAFAARVQELAGHVHICSSLEAARLLARETIGDATVARWDDAVLDGIATNEAPAATADVSLIAADVAVADTGQIAFEHRPGRDRGTGVLPPRQVALLRAADIVQSLPEALSRWFARGEVPGNVVFAAGPSRTADIEQRMVLGAHGPRALDVLVYP